jgi:hypothetical protein
VHQALSQVGASGLKEAGRYTCIPSLLSLRRWGYEFELWQLLERLVGECDKRISRAAERVTRDNEKPAYGADDLAKQEQLKAAVAALNTGMEAAAEEGDVDAAQVLHARRQLPPCVIQLLRIENSVKARGACMMARMQRGADGRGGWRRS